MIALKILAIICGSFGFFAIFASLVLRMKIKKFISLVDEEYYESAKPIVEEQSKRVKTHLTAGIISASIAVIAIIILLII